MRPGTPTTTSTSTSWTNGLVYGLCARGGFVVDMNWHDGESVSATIASRLGGPCVVRYGDKVVEGETTAGERFDVTFRP